MDESRTLLKAEGYKSNPQHYLVTPTLSPFLPGLAAPKEVAALGVLFAGSNYALTSRNGLFFSNLEYVHILLDPIARILRNILARVMFKAVEFELRS